ncbi:MAG: hypothetical protein VR65_21560 [Desulfobulbaceae bacterium BRH_c16a]|nr:MAG: hypothetical protein VR65_21560 [Desulfobulbaceae bacterium BRH_c16a]
MLPEAAKWPEVDAKRGDVERKFPCSGYHIILIRSQSGQIQVGPLLIPHLFSSKHSLQIMKPHGQLQQNC